MTHRPSPPVGPLARACLALALLSCAPVARAGFTSSGTITSWDQTLSDGVVYSVSQSMLVGAWSGYNALRVADGATAVLYIPAGVTLTVNGGNATGTTGAGAAISVPASSTLVVTGQGSLVANGGNGANGSNGGDAGGCYLDMSSSHGGHGGEGGKGGGGAAAAIGGAGGSGGGSGSRPTDEDWVETNDDDDYDRNGRDGNDGGAGSAGGSMGSVYFLGTVRVSATGGSGGSGGSAGSTTSGDHEPNGTHINWYYVGGAGGGGGGAGGIAAPYAIGGGGGGGGGGGSGGNGGLYWAGNYGTGTPWTPDGAGGAGGSENGASASRTTPNYAQNSDGTRLFKRGGLRGGGGAKGSNGSNGSVYKDSGVSISGTYSTSTSASTHAAIEYELKFSDAQRINTTKTAKLGYALPAPTAVSARPGWVFNGWFTGERGAGTKYYDANGTAQFADYPVVGDLTLYASWTLTDPSAAGTVAINGVALVGGQSQTGEGWNYDGATGEVELTTAGKRYVVTGRDNAGEFSICTYESCTVVMSNLTINASQNVDHSPFEAKAGSSSTLLFEGENYLYGPANHPAIYIRENATLTIRDGGGRVKATGGADAPGIGGAVGEVSGTGKLNIEGGTIEAVGGSNGAGIGAAHGSGFGTLTISGGTVTATGQENGAGIGGSANAGMGTYVISGGTVTAKGGGYAPGIGCGRSGIGGTVRITGGTVRATGGSQGAGIGGGESSNGFTVTITGGTVTAEGGNYGAGIGSSAGGSFLGITIEGGTVSAKGGWTAAGIGGGRGGNGRAIKISGGIVTAESVNYGAGIGAGDSGSSGSSSSITIEISGGRVTARSVNDPGIGASDYVRCGNIYITGGTVYASSGRPNISFIGSSGRSAAEAVFIQGGAVYVNQDKVAPDPTDGHGARVFPVDLDIGVPECKVEAFEMGTYGSKFLNTYTDANGILRIWLPSSSTQNYAAEIVMEDGSSHRFCFNVGDDGKVKKQGFIVVNGMMMTGDFDVTNQDFVYTKSTGVIDLKTDAIIAGDSTNGLFRIVAAENGVGNVTLEGLTLVAPNKTDASALDVSSAECTVTLKGDNILAARGQYAAGIEVARDTALTIKGTGSLVAIGGKNAAGIGSAGGFTPPGKILIESGTVVAQGGEKAAGIGGGVSSPLDKADNVVITGGFVTALGGIDAAGIGGGQGKPVTLAAGAVRIAGGTVSATGGGAASAGSTGITVGGSWSDFVKSAGNTLGTSLTDYTLFIDGGSAVPVNGKVSPRPTDSSSNLLYAVSFSGLSPNEKVAVSSLTGDIPATYSLANLQADNGGRLCLWLAPTNHARVLSVNGKYYQTDFPNTNAVEHSNYNADVFVDAGEGGGEPPEEIDIDGETRRVVTLPHLGAGTSLAITGLESFGVSSALANESGDAFLYLPDGEYAFQVNGNDWEVTVEGAPATAHMVTRVFANGRDVGWLTGDGWAYDPATMTLTLSDGCTLSGTNTQGTVSCRIHTSATVTLSDLVLSTASRNGVPALAVGAGTSATVVFSGANRLASGTNAAGIAVPDSNGLTLSGEDGATLEATGGENGGGIGGGKGGAVGTIAISGGAVTATGGSFGAGIGTGREGSGGTVTISGGEVTATGGSEAAGIGGGWIAGFSEVILSGGSVTAVGGSNAAGIGGGYSGTQGGSVRITGGHVTATGGGQWGAGIGAGDASARNSASGVSVEISGGIVRATSSKSAGIGASDFASCGPIVLSGGTVFASTSSTSDAKAIGKSSSSPAESVTITGGAVYPNLDQVVPAPADGASAPVYPVDIPLGEANAKVAAFEIARVADAVAYGMADLYTDETGTLRIWLPAGPYLFTFPQEGGEPLEYVALVKNGLATAVVLKLTGLTVNGRDVAYLGGEGWEYNAPDAALLAERAYTVSGSATNVRVRVVANAAVTLDGVTIDDSENGMSPLVVVSGASASLTLAGGNTLLGGWHSAGLAVEGSASATISGDGSLSATGGFCGAGIGGCSSEAVGAISIAGGTVTATGGSRGAGIGGGYSGTGGTVWISGGTVTADGGEWASGIGAGDGNAVHFHSGIAVEITGGRVTARSAKAAGIGPGDYADCGAISISGGTVYASTQESTAKAIGRARYQHASAASSVSITGGAVYSGLADVLPAPTDGASAAVYPVDIPIGQANAKVETLSFGTPAIAYGTTDIYTDETGTLRIWLPSGDYGFRADGDDWVAQVADAPAEAYLKPLGVTVNGTDVGHLSGEGWAFDRKTKIASLTGAGPYTAAGAGKELGLRAETDCTVTIDGLSITNATLAVSPFDCGTNAVSMVLAGTNSLQSSVENVPGVRVASGASLALSGDAGSLFAGGGKSAAGMGSGLSQAGGSISISGGSVTARGGYMGAGIGGGKNSHDNSISISGGDIFATGGQYAAGIGSGDQSNWNTRTGDTVSISGGRIRAESAAGGHGASIGSSDFGFCAAVSIGGGTILKPVAASLTIGRSRSSMAESVTITGGAVYAEPDNVRRAPSNAVPVAVHPVDFDFQISMADAKIADLSIANGDGSVSYGTTDLYADGNGLLRIWLPDGSYTFTADGETWTSTVAGAPTRAALVPVGVSVNGADVGEITGEGWTYFRKQRTLLLESAGPYAVSGSATGLLCVARSDCEVTFDALSLDNSSDSGRSGFEVIGGANVSLTLAGENVLKGGENAAGLSVADGTSVTIGGDGSLEATGGPYGAGIGGDSRTAVGTVNITNGTIVAVGGSSSAGIGSGSRGNGATLSISGGQVTATGGRFAAAIGSGDQASRNTETGDTVSISGGILVLSAMSSIAQIGSSDYGACGAIAISGGTILSSDGAPVRIGASGNSKAESVTVIGGSVATVSDKISPAASNATARVWRVLASGLEPGAKVDGLEVRTAPEYAVADYGANDLFADGDGNLHVWLPDGSYRLLVSQEGREDLDLAATVNGADTNAVPFAPVLEGVTVNGRDIGYNYGEGWAFIDGIVRLTDAGPFEIAGSATDRGILAEADCAVTITNLALDVSGTSGRAAFAIASGVSVDLTLVGSSTLESGENCAGLQVPAGAAVTIGGDGAVEATGGRFGAGIGGARIAGKDAGEITITGGTVRATGGRSSAGIGGGQNGNGGTTTITGGTVTAVGGDNGAGIGGGNGDNSAHTSGGEITISGGTVTVTAGYMSAGIGGGNFGNAGTIAISGGVVSACGDQFGAGIGGGDYGDGGSITISGGRVSATSKSYAAAIGGGSRGSAGEICITGGTVTASANQISNYAPSDIGAGNNGGAQGSVIVTGGSVHAVTKGITTPAASNATERVECVAFPGFTPNAAVDLGDLKRNGGAWDYGMESLYADEDGKVYLWLPEGDNAVRVRGLLWRAATAAGAVAEAVTYESYRPTGVLVDGVDAARGCGEGWEWWPDPNTLTLSGQAGRTLSGANASAAFKVVVATDAPVTLDGLSLQANEAPFTLAPGVSATVVLGDGASVLKAGLVSYPALEVAPSATLTITNATENGTLTAIGGNDAAGIGGGRGKAVGTIRIAGGTVVARSGVAYGDACCTDAGGAGIGSGYQGTSGDIFITGGRVFAYGGSNEASSFLYQSYFGAGIGGGDSSDSLGRRIVITGGTVVARGGMNGDGDKYAADIGDGLGAASLYSQDNGYRVIIAGGSVHPFHGGKARFTQSKVGDENVPLNGAGAAVHYVPVSVGGANRRVQFAGFENYGLNDIWSDDGGLVHLWLPSGAPTPTPTLMSAGRRGGGESPLYDFMANGYRCTVTAADGGGLAADSEKMPCSELVINGFEVEDGAIRMNVAAEPATWMSGFFEGVKVRASATLPIRSTDDTLLDLAGAKRVVEDDGTVTYLIAIPPAVGEEPQSMFYRVEVTEP